MSEPKTSTVEILVHLVLAGVGTRAYHLPEGATLADLLRQTGVSTTNHTVFVDGILLEDALPLRDGAVVMVAPRPRNAAADEPWRATIPAFRDEALFQEYIEALKARRQVVDPEEGPTA